MQRCAKARLLGLVGNRAEKNVKNYLSTVPFAGNAMFTVFKERELGKPDKYRRVLSFRYWQTGIKRSGRLPDGNAG